MQGILHRVFEVASADGADKVLAVHLQVGKMSGVEPEPLQFAFEALVRGTPAESAFLRVEWVPVACFCESCQREFEPDDWIFKCPICGEVSSVIKRGKELCLMAVEVED